MSATAVAGELGVAERTVRRWVSDGRLHAARAGRELVIDLDEARKVKMQSRHGRSAARLEELAVLQGRYLELRARVDELEAALLAERLRAHELEARLRLQAA